MTGGGDEMLKQVQHDGREMHSQKSVTLNLVQGLVRAVVTLNLFQGLPARDAETSSA
jgi:hypothetical protein